MKTQPFIAYIEADVPIIERVTGLQTADPDVLKRSVGYLLDQSLEGTGIIVQAIEYPQQQTELQCPTYTDTQGQIHQYKCFVITWDTQDGEHSYKQIATTLARNETEAQSEASKFAGAGYSGDYREYQLNNVQEITWTEYLILQKYGV